MGTAAEIHGPRSKMKLNTSAGIPLGTGFARNPMSLFDARRAQLRQHNHQPVTDRALTFDNRTDDLEMNVRQPEAMRISLKATIEVPEFPSLPAVLPLQSSASEIKCHTVV
jgi:hypothetical protein